MKPFPDNTAPRTAELVATDAVPLPYATPRVHSATKRAPSTLSRMFRIVKYVLYDILQSRIVLAYTAFLLAVSFGLFSLGGEATKGLISLLNIVLIVVPLVSMIFSTIHFYNSYEFIELMAAQPIRRRAILLGEFAGVSAAMVTALWVGVGIPVLVFAPTATGFTLLGVSTGLTLVFISLAFLASVITRDKARGIGVSLLLWFYFALLYDALVLFLIFAFADYPMEKATLALVSLNPIDLGRVVVLLQMDISALMGYTGALFREFLGTAAGMAYATFVMLLWVALPILLALRIFKKKDL